ncbi:MAG TPA: 3-hydroxyacyl-CoA dehydrogenase NAD-binding domain-containing protein [Thermoanaerobaculia bacterium]|nr:3-hydroxyacyl-CoA dehydrogenase NAD-binding domain-containing protein [Thermoanaerobaculia bacterium]
MTAILETPARTAFRIEADGDTAVLWFDLPGEKVNKFSRAVLDQLEATIAALEGMREVRYLVLASSKPGIFIAGADLEEFTRMTTGEEAARFVRRGQEVFTRFSKLPQITVAAIDGACMGGGTEISLNCDYRVMSDDPKAKMGLPEVNLGIFPAWTGTTRLPRIVGIAAALDLILTGKNLDGRRAKKIGLVDEVAASQVLLDAAKQLARKGGRKRGSDTGRTRFYVEGNPLARKLIFAKARSSVLQKTGGHYPAPLAAISAMETGFGRGYQAGLAAEVSEVVKIATGEVAANLLRLYFMMEESKKERGPKPKKIASAGVLGAGLMGGGIAQAIVDKADINVRMKDVNWNALAGGMKSAARIWKKKVERRRMTAIEMSRKLAQIGTTLDWSGFADVDVVIEAVLEKLEIKQQVLREFEAVARPDAIFATNTSTIPISKIAEGSARPENVIGMHFFSPADKMPLVEVIRGEKTSPETVATTAAFGRRLGKTVVLCNDAPGFIVNRILGPYLNEAGYLAAEGNSVESIDKAMVDFGMPLGPLALLDEVGIDVAGKAATVLAGAFGERMPSAGLVEKLLADQRFGKKNGRGVYLWKEGKRTAPDPAVARLLGISSPSAGKRDPMTERMVMSMINEASRIVDEKVADSAADVDLAMIMGTGFPPFRGGLLRYADRIGVRYVADKLRALEASHGVRFKPSPALERLAASNRSFYEAYPKAVA